jgi:replicative superfamily II helicase
MPWPKDDSFHPSSLSSSLTLSQALETFLQGKSVVVCAPTGAGKTAIAEGAAAAALARGQRIIYTTPLKVYQTK